MKNTKPYILFIFSVFLLIACEKTAPASPEEDSLLDGPMEGLTTEQELIFLSGDRAFSEVFSVEKGLGPIFVANQCASCHPGDGKGHPFVRFTRFGQSDTLGNQYLKQGAPQLQHKAIPGYQPEQLPAGATFTDLIAPAVTGLGLLDAVSDTDLIALSDPNDINGDGISGRVHWNNIPNYVILRPNAIANNGKYISRFGKKGAAYDLLHQASSAYNQDMGITSIFEPLDPYSGLEEDPEVSTQTINNIEFYLRTLKAPIQRNQEDIDIITGKELFSEIQCAACHTMVLQTGFSTIDALSFKDFIPTPIYFYTIWGQD